MLVKFVIVGDPEVGKSTILQNLCNLSYDPVIGIDVAYHEIEIDAVRPVPIKLKIWDTTGQASLRNVTRLHCKDAAAVLLVYDITRRETFNHLESWLEVSRWHADSKRIITLVGNKCDRTDIRDVYTQEGKEFAKEHGLHFIEASRLTSENIEEVFESMAKEIYERVQEGELHAPDETRNRLIIFCSIASRQKRFGQRSWRSSIVVGLCHSPYPTCSISGLARLPPLKGSSYGASLFWLASGRFGKERNRRCFEGLLPPKTT